MFVFVPLLSPVDDPRDEKVTARLVRGVKGRRHEPPVGSAAMTARRTGGTRGRRSPWSEGASGASPGAGSSIAASCRERRHRGGGRAHRRPPTSIPSGSATGPRRTSRSSAPRVRTLAVLHRTEAEDPALAATVGEAEFVYIADGSPLHLRSVLKDSALFEAILGRAPCRRCARGVGCGGDAPVRPDGRSPGRRVHRRPGCGVEPGGVPLSRHCRRPPPRAFDRAPAARRGPGGDRRRDRARSSVVPSGRSRAPARSPSTVPTARRPTRPARRSKGCPPRSVLTRR